ncbi:MAG: aldo/keto reductase [Lachnospiraceae bacterium]|nr:aldo/keto reductase [Lachnospiraceae bacterium]
MEYATLHNNLKMPLVGLGVYRLDTEEEMTTAISHALNCGYTLFDTAQMYKNEASLGRALKTANMKREDLFLVSKVDNCNQWYDITKKSFMESLEKLQTDYLDLFLIHWPGQNRERTLSTWKAMEELYEEGKIKSIGVSNFEISHLEHLIANCNIKPMVNQIEHTPYTHNTELLDFCKKEQIQIMSWAPLLRGNMGNPIFIKLAEKYNCTTAQLILRWNTQQGITVIPKSKNPTRISENIDIFDITISEEDITLLNSLNCNHRTAHDPNVFDF